MVFYQLVFFTRDKEDILEDLKILLEFENSGHRVSIMCFERTFIWFPLKVCHQELYLLRIKRGQLAMAFSRW